MPPVFESRIPPALGGGGAGGAVKQTPRGPSLQVFALQLG